MNTMTSKQRDLTIRQVSEDEIDKVSGGILPAVGAAVALAGHIGIGGVAASVTGHYLGAFGLGYAVYSAASYYGGNLYSHH